MKNSSILKPSHTKIILNIVFVVVLILMTLHATVQTSQGLQLSAQNLKMSALYFCCFMGICYLNGLIVTPRTLMRGCKGAYFVALVVEVLAVTAVAAIVSRQVHGNEPQGWLAVPWVMVLNALGSVLLIALVLMSTTAYVIADRTIKQRERVDELQRLRRQTELDALRRQVSPHFIFNMLNNVITLIHILPDEGAALLAKLRSLLNYQIEECKQEFMPLDRELDHLREFLDIESVRHDDMAVNMTIEGDVSHLKLPALLFLPVVENAVKHNIPDDGLTPYVNIQAHTDSNGRLTFVCENSCGHERRPRGGLGLKVLRKRLELLYPGSHTLDIEDTATKYTVTITIETR